MLAGLLIKLGLSEKVAKFAAVALIVAAVMFAFWWLRNDAYNDGVAATDAKWELASETLKKEAAKAAGSADAPAAERVAEFTERQAEEKERLDDAEDNGSSPLDVIFGPSGMR